MTSYLGKRVCFGRMAAEHIDDCIVEFMFRINVVFDQMTQGEPFRTVGQ